MRCLMFAYMIDLLPTAEDSFNTLTRESTTCLIGFEEYVENMYFGDFVRNKSTKQVQAREPEKINAKV